MVDEEDGFGRVHPWEVESPIKKRSVSAARVRALYFGGRASVAKKVVKRESLESVVAEDRPKMSYNGARVSNADKERIYVIVTNNLEDRKQGGYKYVQWEGVVNKVYSSLPHLRGISVDRLRSIYARELVKKNRGKKSDGRGRKGDVRFTPEVRKGLCRVFQKYVNPDSGRMERGGWPKVYKEMREEFHALSDVGGTAIKSLFYREQCRKSK